MHKNHQNGLRVALQGRFSVTTLEIYKLALEDEARKAKKRPRREARSTSIDSIVELIEEEELWIHLSVSELDLEDCVAYRTRKRLRR